MVKIYKKRNFFWVSIEGTDCVGKTFFSKKLSEYFQKKGTICLMNDEFSNSGIGNFIRNTVEKENFFQIDKKVSNPFAETLVLASDFIFQFEGKRVMKKDGKKLLIISDRGPHSFFTYQYLRIKDIYGIDIAKKSLKWMENIFFPIGFPDIIILLKSDIGEIRNRIIKRNGFVDKKSIDFIKKVQDEFSLIIKRNEKEKLLVLNNSKKYFDKKFLKAVNLIEELAL